MTETLAISPDLGAHYCYLIVLLFGLVGACLRVSRLFDNQPGAWGTVSIWLLILAYTLVPLLLFWFLDRAGAIHDTSMFAAILVGLSYQQIISGKMAGLRVSGEISKLWQPFESWANWVANRIRDRVVVHTKRFTDYLIHRIQDDDQKLAALKNLALLRSSNPQRVQAEFDSVNTADAVSLWGANGVREMQIRNLYQAMRAVPDADQLMLKAGVIDRKEYYWYAKEWRSKLRAVLVTLVLAVGATIGAVRVFSPDNWASYYFWRLQKADTSVADRFRCKEAYSELLRASPTAEFARIQHAIRYEALPLETADRLLAIAIENRDVVKDGIQPWLIQSLETDNPDARSRVHDALLYLANDRKVCVPAALLAWKPGKTDSATQIDQRMKEWRDVWAAGSSARACAPASPPV